HSPAVPLDAPEFDARIAGFQFGFRGELPGDFLSFYKKCNGVGLFGDALRFRPLEAVEQVEGPTGQPIPGGPIDVVVQNAGPWVRFCDLADGSFVALELRHTYKRGWKVAHSRLGESLPNCPVIAWSFQEFLDRALGSEGRPDRLVEVL